MTMTTEPRVQDSVGAALRTVRENWRIIALISLIGAVASSILQIVGYSAQQYILPLSFLTTFLNAGVYAALSVVALRSWRPPLTFQEGARLWMAMMIVGFFFMILFIVSFIPGSLFLAMGPYAKYLPDLKNAGQNQAQALAVMERIWVADPWPVLGLGLLYLLVFFYLSTRLYFAAPASIDRGRILTFETWAWTKAHVSQIMRARLMLIVPAWILANAVVYLLGRAGESINSAALAAVVIIAGVFCANMLYGALGAALSTALYRDLGGQNAPLPAR